MGMVTNLRCIGVVSRCCCNVNVAVPSMVVIFQLLPQNSFIQTTSTARDGTLSFSKVLWMIDIASQTLQLGGQEAFMMPVYFQTQRFSPRPE